MVNDCNNSHEMQMWVDDGVVHARFAKNLHFNLEMARKFAKCRRKFANGEALPFLIDWSNIISVDKEARQFMAREEAGGFLSAGAFLVATRMQKLICDALFMINRPAFPVAQFFERREALGWLQFYKNLN